MAERFEASRKICHKGATKMPRSRGFASVRGSLGYFWSRNSCIQETPVSVAARKERAVTSGKRKREEDRATGKQNYRPNPLTRAGSKGLSTGRQRIWELRNVSCLSFACNLLATDVYTNSSLKLFLLNYSSQFSDDRSPEKPRGSRSRGKYSKIPIHGPKQSRRIVLV